MPSGDRGKTMNKVSVGEPADGTTPYQGDYNRLIACFGGQTLVRPLFPFHRGYRGRIRSWPSQAFKSLRLFIEARGTRGSSLLCNTVNFCSAKIHPERAPSVSR